MKTYEELKKKYPNMDERFLRNHVTGLKNRDAKDRQMESYVSKALINKSKTKALNRLKK